MSKYRGLTDNEIRAARHIFGTSLDYSAIRIYRGLPFGLPSRNAVSPNGHIYFPKQHCPPDFLLAGHHYAAWLIHELTHVWQHRLGYRTWLGGLLLAVCGGYFRRRAYRCPPPEQLPEFSQLNMEQQAEMVAAYFTACCHPHTHPLPALQTALQQLLDNPADPALRPAYFPRLYRIPHRTQSK